MPQGRERFVGIEAVGGDETAVVHPRDKTEHVGKITEADPGPFHDTAGVGCAALQEKGMGHRRQLLQIGEAQRAGESRETPRVHFDLQLPVVELDIRCLSALRAPHQRVGAHDAQGQSGQRGA